jgi:hypothetical protein
MVGGPGGGLNCELELLPWQSNGFRKPRPARPKKCKLGGKLPKKQACWGLGVVVPGFKIPAGCRRGVCLQESLFLEVVYRRGWPRHSGLFMAFPVTGWSNLRELKPKSFHFQAEGRREGTASKLSKQNYKVRQERRQRPPGRQLRWGKNWGSNPRLVRKRHNENFWIHFTLAFVQFIS